MEKQLIISIGREYGSGGHAIAEILAKRYGIPMYDHNLLDEIAQEKNLQAEELKQYDEVPKKHLLSRTVKGYSNSPEENVANLQFDYLRNLAEQGKSFVVVGRCAEHILREHPAMVSLFILGDSKAKLARIREIRGLNEVEALAAMYRHDKHRKAYHNYYCEGKWGDSRCYELSVNSSKLGLEKTADVIEYYINARLGDMR